MKYIYDGDWIGIPVDTTEPRMIMWNGLDIKITPNKQNEELVIEITNLNKKTVSVRFQWFGMPDEDEEFVVYDLLPSSHITKELPARGWINILKRR